MEETPKVAVDLIVQNTKRHLLLVRTAIKDGVETWTLPGGLMREGEYTSEAASRVLLDRVGIVIPSADLHFFYLADDPQRDKQGHILSLVFTGAKKNCVVPRGLDGRIRFFNKKDVWKMIQDREGKLRLGLDHAEIVGKYYMRERLGLNEYRQS